MPVAYRTFRLHDTPDSYSPLPGALPLTRGALVPGHTSHRGAHGQSWCKSGAHPAVGIEMSAKLHQLWWVPSIERPWFLPGGYHCFLVNLTSSASFLHTPLPCQPHPTLATNCSLQYKRKGLLLYLGSMAPHHCSWSCPCLVSCHDVSCWFLASVHSPEIFLVQESPQCIVLEYSAVDWAGTKAVRLSDWDIHTTK